MTTPYAQMITDCEDRESRMSDWEVGFVADIAVILEKGYKLSERQDTRLNEIWEKVTEDG